MPEPIQDLVASLPNSWPQEFTPQDRELMSAVDFLTVQLCEQFATTAFAYRQQVFTALLKARSALN